MSLCLLSVMGAAKITQPLCLGWVNRRQGQSRFRKILISNGIYLGWLNYANDLNFNCFVGAYVFTVTLEIRLIT